MKNFMKAKAWLFTLLIGMIGLVGFGQTTSDPAQNSAVIVTDNDVGEETTVVNQNLVFVNAFTHQVDGYEVEVKRYKQGDCEYLQFGEIKPITETIVNIVDDVGWQSNYNTLNKDLLAFHDKLIFRSPRDGIRIN